MIDQILLRLKNHAWDSTWRDGEDLARDNIKADATLKEHHVTWELLKEAAKVSPDDVTQWQLLSAYLRGEIESLPSSQTKPSRPTSVQIDRAELILYLWHHYSLRRKGDKSRIKRAVYMKANGVKTIKIANITGLTTKQIRTAQVEACEDIAEQILRLNTKMVDRAFLNPQTL
jgi:hypothetical protein